jgi:hypothetical protein
MEKRKMTLRTGSRFLKISVLSIIVAMGSSLTLFSQSKAEGHYETFQEICEFTGEIKETVVYIEPTMTVMQTASSE